MPLIRQNWCLYRDIVEIGGIKKEEARLLLGALDPAEDRPLLFENGGYLLSHLVGSTIGAGGLNFSVRDGKRWNPATIATLM